MIPQSPVFKESTATGSIFKTRGSNMRRVDKALDAYWKDQASPSVAVVTQVLQDLVKACATWLKKKELKADTKQSGIQNELFVKRKIQVVALGNEALAELRTHLAANGGPTNVEKASVHFHQNKLNTLALQPHQRMVAKPMGQSYQAERSTYLKSGKTKAVSGSGVHEIHNDLTTNTPTAAMYPKKQPGAVVQALRKDVNQLTDADFRALDEYGRKVNLHRDVTYLPKDERDELLTFIDVNGALCDYHDAPITTIGHKIYAMDRYGNLFCNEKDAMWGGSLLFNHSSFNAGNDVICAGNIIVTNGVLTMLDNGSGHYRPTRDHLYNCLTILQQEGADLTATAVNVYHRVGNQTMKDSYSLAALFLANRLAIPDLGTVVIP